MIQITKDTVIGADVRQACAGPDQLRDALQARG